MPMWTFTQRDLTNYYIFTWRVRFTDPKGRTDADPCIQYRSRPRLIGLKIIGEPSFEVLDVAAYAGRRAETDAPSSAVSPVDTAASAFVASLVLLVRLAYLEWRWYERSCHRGAKEAYRAAHGMSSISWCPKLTWVV